VETFDGVCGASDAEVDVVDEIRASAPADQIRLESVVAAAASPATAGWCRH
jgi:hypothetical protein